MCGLARTRNNAGMTSMLPRDLLLRSLPFRGEVSARSWDEAVGAASISSFVCTSFHDFCGTYKHRVEVLYPKRRPVSVQQGRYLKERATSRTWHGALYQAACCAFCAPLQRTIFALMESVVF